VHVAGHQQRKRDIADAKGQHESLNIDHQASFTVVSVTIISYATNVSEKNHITLF
jgi:hypothetical protein